MHGYEATAQGEGKAALDAFNRRIPDALLLDICLPGMDGLTVLNAVQMISPNTPVIMISGTTEMAQALESLRVGAFDYIVKPFESLENVVHAVELGIEEFKVNRMRSTYIQDLEDQCHAYQMQVATLCDQLGAVERSLLLGSPPAEPAVQTTRHRSHPIKRIKGPEGSLA